MKRLLRKFVDDLQGLTDLHTTRIGPVHLSASTMELKIRYPLDILDRSVSQFLSVLFGEIPFMRAVGTARFQDLIVPDGV